VSVRGVVWFLLGWLLRLLPLIAVAVFLHYSLPGHDVVRIVGTEVNRMDRTAADGGGAGTVVTRDVRFINAVRPDGSPAVYRNEDTGWGFPWYFKFNSGDLQAVAQDLVSTQDKPRWVVVTHYGWRIDLFSMFPNAVEIDLATGPDETIIPWFTIILLSAIAIGWFLLWRAWRRFLMRLEIDSRFENASNNAAQVWRWIKANARDLTGRRI
jgi:hypothetical protein